ncbi:MAG: hypothetical protein KGZ40_00935 [Clostridiales bacterium]|nr:hypothetical protein [Clostridiales bacterium]
MQPDSERPTEAGHVPGPQHEPQPAKSERQLALEREDKRRRTLIALSTLAVLAFLLFLVSFAFEDSRIAAESGTRPVANLPADTARVEPPEEPLFTLLPVSLTGYATRAYQDTPYGGGLQAEAVYEPEDMHLQLASPLNVYALLTLWDSEENARLHVERTAAGFPLEAVVTVVGESAALAYMGYDSNRARYFVGHQKGTLSLITYATYSRGGVPVDHRDQLRVHGQALSTKVIDHLHQGSAGE